MPLSDAARAFIAEKVLVHVATLMRDGSPQVTPVWVEADGDDILINVTEESLETRNMRRDGRVAASIIGFAYPWRRIQVRGRIKEITTEGAIEQIDRLSAKYNGEGTYGGHQQGHTRVTVRIEPLRVRERVNLG